MRHDLFFNGHIISIEVGYDLPWMGNLFLWKSATVLFFMSNIFQ